MMAGGAPGVAVASDAMPGYTVAGSPAGAEPAPIGAVGGRYVNASAPGRASTMDRSVMPASVPPPRDPIAPGAHNRPHVIRHLFGLDALGAHHRERVRKKGEAHASIAYDPQYQKVNEVPASVVYGR